MKLLSEAVIQQPRSTLPKNHSISVVNNSDCAWIRCQGKGSFAQSPAIKKFTETQLKKGQSCFVVDLEACPAMDSTFMGTLAGIALELQKKGTKLHLTDVSEKNIASLEDLGLGDILEINATDTPWYLQREAIRAKLKICADVSNPDREQHCYDAHNLLCKIDDANEEKFSTVLEILEKELEQRQQF